MLCRALFGRSLTTVKGSGLKLVRHVASSKAMCNNQEKLESANPAKEMEEFTETAKKLDLTSIDQFRQEMRPFLKEIFCGNFIDLVMSYPDVLTNDRYFSTEERLLKVRKTFADKSELVQSITKDHKVSKDLLLALRSQGFFGLRGPRSHGGEDLSLTESLRLIEEVASANLSMSNIIVNSSWNAVEAIRKHAPEALKDKYLPGLYAGTSIAAICVADEEAGCDPNATLTTAFHDTVEGIGRFCFQGFFKIFFIIYYLF